jgi:P4 family phage/plasmid primase-like protien
MLCLAGTEQVHIPESCEPNCWLDGLSRGPVAVFNNGNVYLQALDEAGRPKMDRHSPAYFTLTKLPYDYDPDAGCPRWREFLLDVMEGDAERIKLLQQWAGYLLSSDVKQQKFLLIAGDGQNGKTVFATILEKMVGEDNVSHVPLSQFCNQFTLSPTLGKVLNSTSESSHGLDEVAETTLKSYTSGDRMSFQRKYKEPIHARPTAKIMISTNQLPQFADKSMGIWRRMLFVPFEKSYPEELQNHELADELAGELPGIFNWAYDGLRMLRRAGRFILPAKCKAATEQYRTDVNPARAFLQDNYVAGLAFEGLPCSQVYQAYVQWCLDNGYRPMNSANFGKEVIRTFPKATRQQKRIGVGRAWLYCGIVGKECCDAAVESGEVCR